jgi:SH3-like domain-containing protein
MPAARPAAQRSLLALLLLATVAAGLPARAATPGDGDMAAAPEEEVPGGGGGDAEGSHSKLPLPRFVSLKSARVNLRVGPGKDYAVSWLYTKPGLPVEIVQEYELWRRIRDAEGTEGWVYHSLLSGVRTGIAAPWLKGKSATVDMRRGADEGSSLVARMEPGVVSKVKECAFSWCEVEAGGRRGYVHQNDIWGVYPDERF